MLYQLFCIFLFLPNFENLKKSFFLPLLLLPLPKVMNTLVSLPQLSALNAQFQQQNCTLFRFLRCCYVCEKKRVLQKFFRLTWLFTLRALSTFRRKNTLSKVQYYSMMAQYLLFNHDILVFAPADAVVMVN